MSRAVALLIFASGAAQASDLGYPAPLGPYHSADRAPVPIVPARGDQRRPIQDRVAHAEFTYTAAPESAPPGRYDASYTDRYGDPWAESEAHPMASRVPDLGQRSPSSAGIARDAWNARERSYYRAETDWGLAYAQPEPRSVESYRTSTLRDYGYPSDPAWCCESGHEAPALGTYRYESPTRSREAMYPEPTEWNRRHDPAGSQRLPQDVHAPLPVHVRTSQPMEPFDYPWPGRLDIPAAENDYRPGSASAPPRWSEDYAGHIKGPVDRDRYAVTWDRDPWDTYSLPPTVSPRTDSGRSARGRPDPAPREAFETIYWSPDWELGYGMKPYEYGLQREVYSDAPTAPYFAPEYQESFYFRPPTSTGRR